MPTNDDDDRICRYCFEGDEAGPLISPCLCKGDQKFVHLKCLRRWQRTVLVSQPTHPAFYEKDPRHYKCNVCSGTFTCEPPTRLELMASFTGPELGALIDAGCIIAAHATFTAELERQMEGMPEILQERSSYAHWCGGCYLITEVTPLDPTLKAPISSASGLEVIKARLLREDNATPLTISHNGQTLRLVPGGALSENTEADLATALQGLEYSRGMELVLQREPPPGCGDDHVTAVNLTRAVVEPTGDDAALVARARSIAAGKYAGCKDVTVIHYNGGPCGTDEISCVVVPGGHGCGWTVVPGENGYDGLASAIELAHRRSYARSEGQGNIHGGQSVKLVGLQARPDLNGELGIALKFAEASGRWLVRLKGGEGKQLKPDNLEPIGPPGGVVHCVWGDAQWSRTQLLGEIARGHWGLCRASIAELVAPPKERWDALDGRLVFAPDTEMMEDFIRQGVTAMEREHQLNERAGGRTRREEEEEEEQEEAEEQAEPAPPAQPPAEPRAEPEAEAARPAAVQGGDTDVYERLAQGVHMLQALNQMAEDGNRAIARERDGPRPGDEDYESDDDGDLMVVDEETGRVV